MASVGETLKAKMPEDGGASINALHDVCMEASKIVASHLGVNDDQVSILILNSSKGTLRFMSPKPLFDSGASFPAKHKSSIASQVIQSKRGKVDNKLVDTRHLKFFENARDLSDSGQPVQKMVALPIIQAGNAIGVVEVIRRGATPDASGDNFSEQDAKKVLAILREATPVIHSAIPESLV